MTFAGSAGSTRSKISHRKVSAENMDPNYVKSNDNNFGHEKRSNLPDKSSDNKVYESPASEIVWRSVILIGLIHLFALIGTYYLLTFQVSLLTAVCTCIHGAMSAMGITAGAHRLWAHRAYKAKLPLRIILIFFNSVACQNSLYEWVRDHRVHHKFTETNADPHNAMRGFFFAHVGWLLVKKHEDVKVKGKTVDMSDLEADPIIMFQKKYFLPVAIAFSFIIPTYIPWLLGHDPLFVCFCATMFRYVVSLNCTWLVNSAAHFWGHKPYDRNINPAENVVVAILASGEGWHNYHHVFPWDYKAAELGNYRLNPTTAFIDFFAWVGWAYDLRTVPKSMVHARVERTGDGTYEY